MDGESKTAAGFTVPMLGPRQRARFGALALAWLASLVWFWLWWFDPDHNIGTLRFAANSAVLAWFTLLPLYLVAIVRKARVPDPALAVPRGLKVAMVVTKTPCEPLEVVARTLEAALAQDYPHDTWLADEDPSAETKAWCRKHGVRISTRKGRADYHRQTWPRRTRCKEGNLAFFYDQYGYEKYDIVSQLDADHVPSHGYLEEMLRPFADPKVGYVSAPSICDSNAAESWAARCRLYVEGPVHGPLQAGYSGGLAPLCIGSHYAVRTKALREIGGLGPELAEDHSTTMMMNAAGWRGVHALNAIAHGDGPRTFSDLAVQEFQWSRSLITILLQVTPRYWGKLPWRLRFQFLFCQLWYPLFALCMLGILSLPAVALFFDVNLVGVTFPEVFARLLLTTLLLLAVIGYLKRVGCLRPRDARLMSWEGMLYFLARWPWWLLGSAAAVRDTIAGRTVEFRVTPKGNVPSAPVPLRVVLPYLLVATFSGVCAILISDTKTASGFYIFAIINSIAYVLLALTILVRHRLENRTGRAAAAAAVPRNLFALTARPAFIAASVLVPLIAVPLRGPQGLDNFLFGSERLVRSLQTKASWIETRWCKLTGGDRCTRIRTAAKE